MEQAPSIVSQLLPLLPAFAIVGTFAYLILRRLRKSARFPRRGSPTIATDSSATSCFRQGYGYGWPDGARLKV